MTSTKRLILLTAIVTTIAAPAASARPAGETSTGSTRSAAAQQADHSTIATHRDQITQQQWEAAAAEPEVAVVDGSTTDGGRFPIAFVMLLTLGVPLGIVLLQVVGKSVRHRNDHRLA